MWYFMLIFELYFVLITIVDFIVIFKKSDKLIEQKNSLHNILKKNRWFGIIAIICAITILSHNFLFMNFIGQYRLEAMPAGTYYCYVEISNSPENVIYPCEVYKEDRGDEPGSYYKLSKIYANGKSINVYEEDIQVFTNHSTIHSSSEYKLINKKYKKIDDIYDNPTKAIFWESSDLFIALCCLYVTFITFKKYVIKSNPSL